MTVPPTRQPGLARAPGDGALGHSRPKAAPGSDAEIVVAFDEAYRMLRRRIGLLLAHPIGSIDQLTLEESLRNIGKSDPNARPALEQTAQ